MNHTDFNPFRVLSQENDLILPFYDVFFFRVFPEKKLRILYFGHETMWHMTIIY
jgi:hypothetical protein